MACTPANHSRLLNAAMNLLAARRDDMLELEHWVELARATATCAHDARLEVRTADFLPNRDIETAMNDPDVKWTHLRDGELEEA